MSCQVTRGISATISRHVSTSTALAWVRCFAFACNRAPVFPTSARHGSHAAANWVLCSTHLLGLEHGQSQQYHNKLRTRQHAHYPRRQTIKAASALSISTSQAQKCLLVHICNELTIPEMAGSYAAHASMPTCSCCQTTGTDIYHACKIPKLDPGHSHISMGDQHDLGPARRGAVVEEERHGMRRLLLQCTRLTGSPAGLAVARKAVRRVACLHGQVGVSNVAAGLIS